MHINVRLPSPLGTLRFTADGATPVGALLPPSAEYYIRTRARLVDASTPVSELAHSDTSFPIDLELVPRVLGGKGGFGANLRAAGGRMNASKSTNFDSCRDLNGRRLGAVKEAQRQADLVESLPELQAKAAADTKAKLEGLERKLGISSSEAGDSAGSKRLAEVDIEELARKKHKFDDNKFLEESHEIKENVRSAVGSAVGAALLKKKKKKVEDKDAAAAGPSKAAPKAAPKAAVKAAPKAPAAPAKVSA